MLISVVTRAARAEALHAQQADTLQRLQLIADQLAVGLEDAAMLQKRQATEIARLQSELQVAEESTIPALVAHNELLLARIDAELAVQVRGRVAASMPRGDDR